jgi:DNA-binding NtrC family response regulator
MGTKDKLIYFVDDDRLILNLLEYTFNNREGYEVHSFLNGAECLAALDKSPRVVVVDHYFTKNDSSSQTGMDVLKTIKSSYPEVEVVILSNQNEKELIDEYLKEGAYKFIKKNDYFIDELISTLEQIFSRSKN